MESIPHPAFSLRPPHRPHPSAGAVRRTGGKMRYAFSHDRMRSVFLLGQTYGSSRSGLAAS
jgi:hypothetical protein